jgi:hypothetical protein
MAYNSTSWTTDANTKAGSTETNTVGGVTLYANFFTHNNESLNFEILILVHLALSLI